MDLDGTEVIPEASGRNDNLTVQDRGDANAYVTDRYSKDGHVIGKMQIKISFMKKRLFPEEQVNLLYQNQANSGYPSYF